MTPYKLRHCKSFVLRKKTRAAFKLALGYCEQNVDMMEADSYAKKLTGED